MSIKDSGPIRFLERHQDRAENWWDESFKKRPKLMKTVYYFWAFLAGGGVAWFLAHVFVVNAGGKWPHNVIPLEWFVTEYLAAVGGPAAAVTLYLKLKKRESK